MKKIIDPAFGDRVEFSWRSVVLLATALFIACGAAAAVITVILTIIQGA